MNNVWQPMETASRTERVVLDLGTRVVVGRWVPASRDEEGDEIPERWLQDAGGQVTPLRWMRLPEGAIVDTVSSDEKFSVWQFFPGETNERVRHRVSLPEAFSAFEHYCTSVGARHGFTQRVIIVDGGDSTVAEWKFGEGIVWPPLPQTPGTGGNA